MERVGNVNLINAYNSYNMTLYNANEQRKAIIDKWVNRGIAYKNIMDNLHLSVPQFIAYMKSDIIRTSQVFSSI